MKPEFGIWGASRQRSGSNYVGVGRILGLPPQTLGLNREEQTSWGHRSQGLSGWDRGPPWKWGSVSQPGGVRPRAPQPRPSLPACTARLSTGSPQALEGPLSSGRPGHQWPAGTGLGNLETRRISNHGSCLPSGQEPHPPRALSRELRSVCLRGREQGALDCEHITKYLQVKAQ